MPVLEQTAMALVRAMFANPGQTFADLEATLARAKSITDAVKQHIADAKPTIPDDGKAVDLPPDAPAA